MKKSELKQLIKEAIIADDISNLKLLLSEYKHNQLVFQNKSIELWSYFNRLEIEVLNNKMDLIGDGARVLLIDVKDIINIHSNNGKQISITTKTGKINIQWIMKDTELKELITEVITEISYKDFIIIE